MSAQSEETPTNNPLDALDALVASSRRLSERPEPRLAAVNSAPVARTPRLDAARLENLNTRLDTLNTTIAAGDRLESAMNEFVRRQLQPQAVPEPADFKRYGRRRMLMASSISLAAVAAAACFLALLYVTVFPREKDAIQSFIAGAPAASPLGEASDASRPEPSRALVGIDGGNSSNSNSMTHEQSEQLLQQFVQWQQKTASANKP